MGYISPIIRESQNSQDIDHNLITGSYAEPFPAHSKLCLKGHL